MTAIGKPFVEPFFDPTTGTITYVVYDREGGRAAIIDPVLDYDPKSGRTSTGSADQVIDLVMAKELGIDWILETHAHADHLSAAQYLKRHLGGRVAIGERIREVQATFKRLYNADDVHADGRAFDHLFADSEAFRIGDLEAHAVHVAGHTPADMAYLVGDAAFVGDTLFMPDVGTARTDFPGGDARTLFRSLRRLLDRPGDTRIFVCHDYPPAGRGPQWQTSVADQRRANIHVHDGVTEECFVRMREERDATLEAPVLLLPSIQVNIRAGHPPPPEGNGVSYLKIPLDAL